MQPCTHMQTAMQERNAACEKTELAAAALRGRAAATLQPSSEITNNLSGVQNQLLQRGVMHSTPDAVAPVVERQPPAGVNLKRLCRCTGSGLLVLLLPLLLLLATGLHHHYMCSSGFIVHEAANLSRCRLGHHHINPGT
jgi:hypothetical protein